MPRLRTLIFGVGNRAERAALNLLGYDAASLLAPSPVVEDDPMATIVTSSCSRNAEAKPANERPSALSVPGVSQGSCAIAAAYCRAWLSRFASRAAPRAARSRAILRAFVS